MAAATEEEITDAELEVATILCGLKKTLRARGRRRRRRAQRLLAAPELPSWGRRRPRSMPEEKPAAPAPVLLPASGVAERDGAASPDTPLAYPESGGDDAPMEEEDAKKPTSHDQVSRPRDLRARAAAAATASAAAASLRRRFAFRFLFLKKQKPVL